LQHNIDATFQANSQLTYLITYHSRDFAPFKVNHLSTVPIILRDSDCQCFTCGWLSHMRSEGRS